MKRVYFDNAATTVIHPKVFDKMLPFLKENFGNPSSIHYHGRNARVAVESAREIIADFINADPGEIYFCSNGTEANNFPVLGIARANKNETGKTGIIISEGEHLCILEPANVLIKEGYSIKRIPLNRNGGNNLEYFPNSISENTSLVSIIHINNETGAENDIHKIASLTKEENTYFHTDAVQSFGKIKIDVKKLGVDSLSATGHKIYGPKGIGFAYIKSGTPVNPLIVGGSQERNRRGGTENVAAIVGLAEAVKIAELEMENNSGIVQTLRTRLISGIKNLDNQGILINNEVTGFPYVLSITLKNNFYKNDAESILMYLDINGISASNGAACSSGTLKISHVISAMGLSDEDAKGTIRFSFSPENTFEEVDYCLEIISNMLRNFKK
ncbi:MAG: cysteine desulfurase [Ignavibacteria bacterium]|nr:cysteine desulfurase [Ignavibacteria bacterium]